nr:MAG TPA: hypothetical protein [Caudoviricetes sp.]
MKNGLVEPFLSLFSRDYSPHFPPFWQNHYCSV